MKCQYEVLYADKGHMKSKLCNKSCVTSFCAEHAYCQELLDAARALDYPDFTIAVCYTISSGRGAWEAYALRHPLRRHDDLMQRLKASRTRQDRQGTPELAEVV